MNKSYIVLFVLIINALLYSDVIMPYQSADKFSFGLSIEKIFTYEKRLGPHISLLPWAGIGGFWTFYQKEEGSMNYPAVGAEMAFESRLYPFTKDLSKYFIGLYGGGAFMFPSYISVGASIGFKTGYKFIIKGKDKKRDKYRFSFEPYGSISTLPVAWSTYYKSSEIINFPGAILTIGIRFVSEWRKKSIQ